MANRFEKYAAPPAGPPNRFQKYAPLAEGEDPIVAEVRREMAADRAKGVPPAAGASDLWLQGMTLNNSDEVAAGVLTIPEMFRRRTLDFTKAYEYAKAREDLELEDAKKRLGLLGKAAELGGGVMSGAGLAGRGLTLMRAGAPLRQATLRSAGDAALFGAASGVGAGGEGTDTQSRIIDRLEKGVKGAVVGGLIGGAIPPAMALARPVIGLMGGRAIMGMLAPEDYARSLAARAIGESGQSVRELRRGIRSAEMDAQGEVWTLGDQLGYPGQRLLAGATQAPSMARQEAHEFLRQRQAGQGERMGQALEEGMSTAQTAELARRSLIDARDDTARVLYGDARAQAGEVDLTPVIQRLDQELNLTPGQATATPTRRGQAPAAQRIREADLPADSIARSLARVRNSLTDLRQGVTIRDWGLIYRARQDLADMIERSGLRPAEQGGGYNNQGRILAQVRGMIDDSLERASAPYRAAADAYRADSAVVEAVELGERAAMGTGPFARYQDNVVRFQALNPRQQVAFRAGYVSQLLNRVEKAASGRNQANMFSSIKTQRELDAFAAPGRGPRLQRSMGREDTMFGTRQEAFGGSATVRNLNDQQPVNDALMIIANLIRGDVLGATANVVRRTQSYGQGYTPQVREHLIRMLMQRPGQRGNRAAFDRFTQSLTAQQRVNMARELLSSSLLRGAYGGVGAVGQ